MSWFIPNTFFAAFAFSCSVKNENQLSIIMKKTENSL